MARYKLTESDLHKMIYNVAKRVLNEDTSEGGIPKFTGTKGNRAEELEFCKSLIQMYKDRIIDKVDDFLYDYDFSDRDFDYDYDYDYGRRYRRGDPGYASDDMEIECDFTDEEGEGEEELMFYTSVGVDITEHPGDPGNYYTPPSYDEYEYEVTDIYVTGIYFYDGENEIHFDGKEIETKLQ